MALLSSELTLGPGSREMDAIFVLQARTSGGPRNGAKASPSLSSAIAQMRNRTHAARGLVTDSRDPSFGLLLWPNFEPPSPWGPPFGENPSDPPLEDMRLDEILRVQLGGTKANPNELMMVSATFISLPHSVMEDS